MCYHSLDHCLTDLLWKRVIPKFSTNKASTSGKIVPEYGRRTSGRRWKCKIKESNCSMTSSFWKGRILSWWRSTMFPNHSLTMQCSPWSKIDWINHLYHFDQSINAKDWMNFKSLSLTTTSRLKTPMLSTWWKSGINCCKHSLNWRELHFLPFGK